MEVSSSTVRDRSASPSWNTTRPRALRAGRTTPASTDRILFRMGHVDDPSTWGTRAGRGRHRVRRTVLSGPWNCFRSGRVRGLRRTRRTCCRSRRRGAQVPSWRARWCTGGMSSMSGTGEHIEWLAQPDQGDRPAVPDVLAIRHGVTFEEPPHTDVLVPFRDPVRQMAELAPGDVGPSQDQADRWWATNPRSSPMMCSIRSAVTRLRARRTVRSRTLPAWRAPRPAPKNA